MTKQKPKTKNYFFWLLVGFGVIVIAAPNALFVKMVTNQIDGLSVAILRNLLMAGLALPFALFGLIKRHRAIRRHLR